MSGMLKIALAGNPNSGKSSLFNLLTGLNQKVGNFPGVTVERKTGECVCNNQKARIIDLPGVYSLYPGTEDEKVSYEVLTDSTHDLHPDVLVVVVDASNLRRNLLLFSQLYDLGLPTLLVLTKTDTLTKAGYTLNVGLLKELLHIPVFEINARSGKGLKEFKNAIFDEQVFVFTPWFEATEATAGLLQKSGALLNTSNNYVALLGLQNAAKDLACIPTQQKEKLLSIAKEEGFDGKSFRAAETIHRFEKINGIIDKVIHAENPGAIAGLSPTDRIDRIVTHPLWGGLIFFGVLFLVFQAIFHWASYPMELIERATSAVSGYILSLFPESSFAQLLAQGVVPGLGGIVMFVPQIAVLFFLISLLEESGYMARVVFLTDRLFRKFGLNGKSVVPLISGAACAVPAIMAARTIPNSKERLITIMVTPLISCSARLPVYAVLIALVIPEVLWFGVFNLQGLVLLGMYVLGLLAALGASWVMKKMIKAKERSLFIMEMPNYEWPNYKNVLPSIVQNVKAFVWDAGRIILAISIILWALASFSPTHNEAQIQALVKQKNVEELPENIVASTRLEYSYAGYLGKMLEPVIKPLGYDWKIGVALVTSFAAREVFIGTMATLYSLGEDENIESTLTERMKKEVHSDSGRPVFTLAAGVSLLIFYAFAMQCMSTLAVVKRETKSWKYPIIQLAYMTALAYAGAWLAYRLLAEV